MAERAEFFTKRAKTDKSRLTRRFAIVGLISRSISFSPGTTFIKCIYRQWRRDDDDDDARHCHCHRRHCHHWRCPDSLSRIARSTITIVTRRACMLVTVGGYLQWPYALDFSKSKSESYTWIFSRTETILKSGPQVQIRERNRRE